MNHALPHASLRYRMIHIVTSCMHAIQGYQTGLHWCSMRIVADIRIADCMRIAVGDAQEQLPKLFKLMPSLFLLLNVLKP